MQSIRYRNLILRKENRIMAIHKKELEVAALENGTVIDHIPSNQLFKVVSLLGLEHLNKSITIGNNLIS